MTTILFLSPRFPWPLIGGDRVKAYFLLKHLARSYRVILVTFSHGKTPTPDQIEAMRAIGVELHTVTLEPVKAGLASIRTLWTNLPLEIAFYTRPEFQHVVDDLLKRERIDLVVSFFMRTAEYIRKHPNMPRILVAEDCRVEYQTRSSSSARSLHQRLVRWWETRKLLAYEPEVVNDFDLTTFVSPEDVAAMKDLNDHAAYQVVTNGVDLERFSYVDDQSARSGVLFAGKLDVLANHLMAGSIVRDVFPMVQVLHRGATLTIAGANPKSSLRSMLGEGMELHADVPDLVPYLHRYAVFLHPHHGGSGIQNKVLEAMSAGCAVVTTPSGLQGIDAVHEEHCLVGTSDTDLADNTARLLADPALRQRLARNARTLMERTHSWDHVEQQMITAISTVLAAHS